MRIDINCFTLVLLHNLGLMSLIGIAIYLTREPWVLLGLLFCKTCETSEDDSKSKEEYKDK